MAVPGGTKEMLADIPRHVWKGFPDSMRLSPSVVDPSRIGVWASRLIPKGKRFGPFVGEKKKRSQVSSNVYMWEVYFPARGWMCVDATDPMKGNWLRYVNWAHSTQEQNLFPMEINRAIYYKVLRPIGPGEDLLVWYNGEDNPEITAALEEERASNLNKKNSPRAKRARKLLERARQAGLGGFRGPKQTGGTKPIVTEMWDTEEGPNEEDERPSPSPGPSQGTRESSTMGSNSLSQAQFISAAMREKDEGDEEDPRDLQQWPSLITQSARSATEAESEDRSEQPDLPLSHSSPGEVGPGSLQTASSLPRPEPEADPYLDLDLESEPHGEESHPCQHCERHFSTKQGLERHTHIHATANQQTHTFKCRYCGKSFGSQVGRRRHERRHENGPKNKGQRPGSLAGTATLLSPLGQADCSSPDCATVSGHYVVMGSPVPGGLMQSPQVVRKDPAAESDQPFIVDENGETKELHPCKYCNKAFGTHTNMRRHQRRIHERHLLPKGVRRKGMLLQESPQQQRLPEQSPSASPPPVYVPSADTEDEGDREEYMVDISNNISENLSLYIDGKILSTSSVSGCEVIEVDSSSAALFGLDAVVISPNQISQAFKVDTRTCAVKQVSNLGQPTTKRRTSTPPLMPSLKMESENGSSSSSSTSSSSALLVESLFPQSSDSLAFQKEKTIYLSPKLKQLLQTQTDSQKPTIALIADSHRLAPPLSVASLPAASGRFKRRTASPPSSPQLSPALKADGCKSEAGVSSYTLKVPKLESLGMSSAWSLSSKEERDTLSPSGKDGCSWSASRSGGNSCNQQPLDLSSGISKWSDGFNKTPREEVLDLSMSRKSTAEPESKGSPAPTQPHIKKKKPNTSMLEKVLMNEYAGLNPAGEEGSCALGSPDSQYTASSGTGTASHSPSSNMPFESADPSPPSLTPVTMNPSSPCVSSLTSPTPPPPVLPSMPSPDCPTSSSLPVLSPKMSPRSIDHCEDKPVCVSNSTTAETILAAVSNSYGDEKHVTKPVDHNTDPVIGKALSNPSTESPSVSDAVPVSLSSAQSKPARSGNHSFLDIQINPDLEPIITDGQGKSQCSELPVLSPVTESPLTASSTSPVGISDGPASSVVSPASLSSTVIKEEAQHMDQLADLGLPPGATGSSPQSAAAAEKPSEVVVVVVEEGGLEPDPFSKSFVCNVCEDPFRSIKELSRHIVEHASEWPYRCEFCVQLFGNAPALLEHRTALHGVGRIFVCSFCSKEFAFLCNLQQHHKDLHPSQPCTHTAVESGKLRPQNYTDPARAKEESNPSTTGPESSAEAASSQEVYDVKKEEQPDTNGKHEEAGPEDPTEELYTTIKIMASEGGKPKGPDVRLGINQHYPSFKPPPFPYHNRTAADSVASATNFTTHNIPQTFSTAIRCTKCGKSFDNMPELHKHILACANASDKRRYTPKKNPIPLRQIVKPQNGALSPASAANAGHNAFRRMGQPKRLNFNQEPPGKTKMSSLSKKKNQLVQKAITQRNKTAATANKAPSQVKEEEPQEVHVCPHCSREFTYPASLSKHIAVSCPMKPVSKKAQKGAAAEEATPAVDKNMSLRRRTTDSEIQQPETAESVPKTLGKTRARTSGPGSAEAETPLPPGKGKTAVTQVRTKRPASFPAATVSLNLKSKKGKVQSLPPTLLPSETPSDSAPLPATQTKQRMGKEMPPKKVAEVKFPLQKLSQVPPKKEGERFSLRARERAGGPVTRSLQMANSVAPGEVKIEDLSSQGHKETQEPLLK